MASATSSATSVDGWAEARVAGDLTFSSDTTVTVYATDGNLPTGSPLAVSAIVKTTVVVGMHSFNFLRSKRIKP